ncbi:MAG: DUF1800 domain-containing protein [Planctomycetes bacterium]|nr:DUF1800 domain-containing protein [Planctomycetota bacterium]
MRPFAEDLLLPYRVGVDGPFGAVEATHLLARTEFGAAPERLEDVLALGLEKSLLQILQDTPAHDPWAAMGLRMAFAENRAGLQAWWLRRMIDTPAPWHERLAHFWHDHFACSDDKVHDLASMTRQNLVFLAHGNGSFGTLLHEIMKDPALLFFLDNGENSRLAPNENLARELLELFTVGIGHFDEADVKQAARALTGWGVFGRRFAFVKAMHDDGEKAVLAESGAFDGAGLVEVCLRSKWTAQSIATKLCQAFVAPVASDAMRSTLGTMFREVDLDVGRFMHRLFGSRLFFASRDRLIKSPCEFVVGLHRSLKIRPDALVLAQRVGQMGEELYFPPSVAGWERGPAWLSSGAVLLRQHFARDLATVSIEPPSARDAYRTLRGTPPDARLQTWLDEVTASAGPAEALALVLSLPEMQTW